MTMTIIIGASILCLLLLVVGVIYLRPSEIEITDKAIDLSSVIPIQVITDGVIVNGNGDLTLGYKMFLPEVFTLSRNEALHFHERLEALLKMLPAGTVIHQQICFYTSRYNSDVYTTNPIMSENWKHLSGKELINSYVNLYLTFTDTQISNGRKKSSASSLLRRFNYPFTQPFKHLERRLEDIEPSLLNFENALHSLSLLSIKKMTSAELNNAVFDYMNQSYNEPTIDATKESLNPMLVTKQGDFKIGEMHISIISLTDEGSTIYELKTPTTGKAKAYGTNMDLPENIKSKCSMIYPLGLGLPFDHVVNVIIEVTDKESTVEKINNEKTALNPLSKFFPKAEQKQAEQKMFVDTVSKGDHQTSYTAFNVVVKDPEKAVLMRKVSLVKQGYSFMNQSSCYIENAELCNLFFCSIPGNARANYRGFINTVEQAICYMQKDSTYISDLKGYLYNDRFGRPILINLWSFPGLNNKNRIVIGPSGSGKSFWLNNYILQSFELGRDVMIIDIGGSYKSMINLNGGKYFDSTNQKQFAFNPFLCEQDKNGRYIYLDHSDDESTEDLIKTIVAILSYIWKGQESMTQSEAALLRKSIISFYDYVNNSSVDNSEERIFPCLNSYRDYLESVFPDKLKESEKKRFDTDELVLLLERYTTGELSFLLNSKENVDIVNDELIAFDMEDAAKQDYFPIVAIITLQMVIDKIKKREGVMKELIIDEGLDFLKDPKFGDFIAYLYRTFRKKEGSITLAAQNVLFLKDVPADIKNSILINCDTKIILDHSKYRENLPDIQNVLSITEEEITMIESLQEKEGYWKEFFIKLGNSKFVFRNEVSPFAAVAFDSKQSTVVRIKQLFEESGSTYTAINRYIEERRVKYG